MKFLVILATFFLASNAALDKDFLDTFVARVKSIGEECVPETSASQDDITVLLSHNIPETHEGKCLIFCFHRHFHFQNDDGSIDRKGALQALAPLKTQDMDIYAKILKVFQTCGDGTPVDSDPCEYSANLAQCAVKEGTAMGLEELLLVEFE